MKLGQSEMSFPVNSFSLFRIPLGDSSSEDLTKFREEGSRSGTEMEVVASTENVLYPIDSLFSEGVKALTIPTVEDKDLGGEALAKRDIRKIERVESRDELQSSPYDDDEASSIFSGSDTTSDAELVDAMVPQQEVENQTKRKNSIEIDSEETENRSKKKRGRPPRDGSTSSKIKRRSKEAKLASNGLSVRSIPCFYEGCTYSYKRPGSTIVEISDRPLLLPKKFDGYTIRSCKKHHDKWKHKETKHFCDVCRGLNCEDPSSVKRYTNNKSSHFNLCVHCCLKQRDMLQLLPGSTDINMEEIIQEGDRMEGVSQHGNIEEHKQSPPNNKCNSIDEGKGDDVPIFHENSGNCYIIYRKTIALGWNLCKEITYLASSIWESELYRPRVNDSRLIYLDEEGPYPLIVRKVKDDEGNLGLFASAAIPKGTCLGEYTGRVVEKARHNRQKRFSISFNNDLEVDATNQGNELRFIGDSLGLEKICNVRFETVEDVVLAFSTKKIKKNTQLFADYGSGSEKEKMYIETFNYIHQFNKENLSVEEAENSAFIWFVEEGYKLLHQKAKITVPIDKRFPSKKGIANNHNIKRHSNVTKNETEWGYVAQLEKLDLERAREDCWVSFKAGKYWNYDTFNRVVTAWKKSVNLPSTPKKTMQVPLPVISQKKKKTLNYHEKHEPRLEKPIRISTVNPVGTRQLEEIQYADLSIKFDGALLGSTGQGYAHVFKGYWKGYPVAVRFPALKVPVGEEEKQKFIDACTISAISHPNVVTSYACCKREQVCLIMELMNLGNLKHWIMQPYTHAHATYIPRIALDIARGMEYIHSKNTIHGNLKSSNVLMKGEVLEQGFIANLEVKIGDLGAIADDFSNRRQETEHFTAPECQRTRTCSRESDVYSFGKILCHLFSQGREEPADVISTLQYLEVWDPKWKELIVNCTHAEPELRPNFIEILDILTKLNHVAS